MTVVGGEGKRGLHIGDNLLVAGALSDRAWTTLDLQRPGESGVTYWGLEARDA